MLLATYIKDMNFEEILGIFAPILFLVPLAIVIFVVIPLAIKLWGKLGPTRLFLFMNLKGISETKKRNYLKSYLTRDAIFGAKKGMTYCPVCGKKYATIIKTTNARGDTTTGFSNVCPCCNTQVLKTAEENNARYLYLQRSKTSSKKEAKYQKTFDSIKALIDFYKPYIDTTNYSDDDNIRVDVYFH